MSDAPPDLPAKDMKAQNFHGSSAFAKRPARVMLTAIALAAAVLIIVLALTGLF